MIFKPTRWSIRSQLLGLVLLSLLPAVGLSGWFLFDLGEQARKGADRELLFQAVATAENIGQEIEDSRLLLERLTRRDEVRAMDPQRCDPVFSNFGDTNPGYTTLGLRRLDGTSVCSFLQPAPSVQSVVTSRWFAQGRAAPGLYVGDAYQGRVTRRWTATLTHPVRDEAGAVVGLLVTALDLETLNRRVSNPWYEGSIIAVVDGSKNVLLRSSDFASRVGKPVAPNFAARLDEQAARRDPLHFNEKGVDGVARRYVTVNIPGTPWRVNAGLPEEKLASAARAGLRRNAAVGVVLLAAALALAWWIAGFIGGPVRRLAAVAAGVAEGHTELRATADGPIELAQVAKRFNQMLDARAQAEEQLRQSADRTRRILRAAAVGLWEWNLLTDSVYFSPEWKGQLGYADDEIANRFDEWQKRVHPDDLARAMAAVSDFRDGRTARYAVEIRLLHRDGSWRWIYAEADLERNDRGEPVMMSGSQIDITVRKQAEAAASELERRFRESQKMEAVGTLASSIAHDFNNIIGAILGNAALAGHDLPADHPAALSVAQIQVAGLRARSLVQKILSFTRRQAPQMQAQPLRALVEEAIELLRATLPSGVTISRVLPVEPVVALVDATQVNQLLMNLGINAWHALLGQAGQIEVGLEAVSFDALTPPPRPGLRLGLAAHLWVRDSGCGIAPEVIQRIVEPFFTTKMTGQGTGLGLAAVAGAVQSHGGVLDVDSTRGEGSCFHIYLPALEAPALAPSDKPAEHFTAPIAPTAPTAPAALAANGQRVMFIDDDDVMRLVVERMLERAGFRASSFAGGAEALAALRAAPLDCDLVVTDYNMPQMSGLNLARAVTELRADLPVILTTGSLTDELIASALKAGVSALVNKERAFEDLVPQALLVLAKAARYGPVAMRL